MHVACADLKVPKSSCIFSDFTAMGVCNRSVHFQCTSAKNVIEIFIVCTITVTPHVSEPYLTLEMCKDQFPINEIPPMLSTVLTNWFLGQISPLLLY